MSPYFQIIRNLSVITECIAGKFYENICIKIDTDKKWVG